MSAAKGGRGRAPAAAGLARAGGVRVGDGHRGHVHRRSLARDRPDARRVRAHRPLSLLALRPRAHGGARRPRGPLRHPVVSREPRSRPVELALGKPLERMLELGIDPIVDLVHYGTPRWIEGGFLAPEFPEHMAEYAARVAERYRGRIRWYTPLNEPRIAAWYAGRLGWWPSYRRSWRGFVAVLLALGDGMARTDRALRAVDDAIVPVHVDASDVYTAAEPALAAFARQRQALVFLALDVLTGRVTPRHPLFPWLVAHGARPDALAAHAAKPVRLELLGVNLYAMFTAKRVVQRNGVVHVRMTRAGGEARRSGRRHVRPPLRLSRDDHGDRGARLAGAADRVARRVGRGGAAPPRARRAGRRVHLVADVRARRVGVPASIPFSGCRSGTSRRRGHAWGSGTSCSRTVR